MTIETKPQQPINKWEWFSHLELTIIEAALEDIVGVAGINNAIIDLRTGIKNQKKEIEEEWREKSR